MLLDYYIGGHCHWVCLFRNAAVGCTQGSYMCAESGLGLQYNQCQCKLLSTYEEQHMVNIILLLVCVIITGQQQ